MIGRVAQAGYDVVGRFVLPESSWWRQYYTPLERRIPLIEERYRAEPAMAEVVEGARREIETYRTHAACYGYLFVVARPSWPVAPSSTPRLPIAAVFS